MQVRRAVIDPWGVIELEAVDGEDTLSVALEFAPFALPFGMGAEGIVDTSEALRKIEVTRNGRAVEWSSATFSCSRAGKLVFRHSGGDGEAIEAEVDLDVTRLEKAEILGMPPGTSFARPALVGAQAGDLVFCCVGNTGTGLPGAREVASAMSGAALASRASLCFLLGDIIYSGAALPDAASWRDCVDPLFPAGSLDGPVHLVLGDRDYRGKVGAYAAAKQVDPRWQHDALVYDFEVDCHGKKVLCVIADTTAMLGSVRQPETRHSRRHLQNVLERDADWKLVFGHHPLVMAGRGTDDADRAKLRSLTQLVQKADVYFSGGDHHLEITEPIDGVVHVNAGGGGGPDAAASARWQDHTRFAATGGGFALVRCDGDTLRIALRGHDGRPLFVETLDRKGS